VILIPSITNYHSEGPPIFNLNDQVSGPFWLLNRPTVIIVIAAVSAC
jgi:hypothetical protein